jgi:hypothetical protein
MAAPDHLLEKLAELEHEQWVFWSRGVAGEVSEERRQRWQRWWVPYAQLPEEIKEDDLVWARKVLALLEGLRGEP